ncbi:hypothetical protein KUV80_11410 [Fictibacillus nanhaiensis]|uniref:hypothetical protein n=1 Tax=Fictibacillus nanhaiensis TaxID=742169 RepID=UPI001C983A94|nr:hypothetical protein [Fictibacillus nanhaiensis]MBY6037268.1 hypothetical protein [Fictibacillus nanhaiensis]
MGIIELLIARANTAVVTKKGDDRLASIGGKPFKTINGAITAINTLRAKGITILVFPGIYEETVSIPAGNSLQGLCCSTVVITKQEVTSNTTLVTMGEQTTLESVTLLLTSSVHVSLIGVAFPGITTRSAIVKQVAIEVDNATAPSSGTSNVYGVHSYGTGLPDISIDNINNSTIIARSAGLGNKRALLVDTNSHNFNCRNSVFLTTRSAGGGSYIGAEVNASGSLLNLQGCSIEGQTADISQTAGSLNIGSTDLILSNANSLGFSTTWQPSILVWAQSGVIAAGTSYYRPGTAALTSTDVFIRLSQKCVIKTLSVRSLVGPGIGTTVVWTIRKNGEDTPLTVSMNNSQTSAINEAISVNFDAGDNISLEVTVGNLSTIADTVVQVDVV